MGKNRKSIGKEFAKNGEQCKLIMEKWRGLGKTWERTGKELENIGKEVGENL